MIQGKIFYRGTEEELITFFEKKYPLKPENTFPRVESEYYEYDEGKTIRYQIENSKNAFGMVFYKSVVDDDFGSIQTLNIHGQYFFKTDDEKTIL